MTFKERAADQIKLRDPEFAKVARAYIEESAAFEILYGTWADMHYGDEYVGKYLIATIANGSNKKSKGVHVCVIGSSGCGKSDSQEAATKILPPEYLFDGSITPQSLYYAGGSISPGSIISIEDLRWNDDLGESVKKITSRFQEPAQRLTVTDGMSALETASEQLTFWVSQVDMQADEQIRDRFIICEIDSSEEHINKVKEFLGREYMGKNMKPMTLDESIKLCQEMVRVIRESGPFEVVIPFADRIHVPGDLRPYRMFMDTISAFTIFRFPVRKKDEEGRLIATEQDFKDAKKIWDGIGGISRDKLGSAECDILQAIIDHGYKATFAEIAKTIGKSETHVRNIVFGRNGKSGQQNQGLLAKCKGNLTVEGEYRKKLVLSPGFSSDGITTVWLEADASSTQTF